MDRVVRGTRTSCRPDPLDARAYVDESAAGDAIAPRRILARGARCAAPSVNLARKIKAKSALLHRQRFVLTKSYVQLNKCYGKLDITEQKDVRFITELALPQSSPEENHRAGLGRLRDESQSPRFSRF